MIRRRKIWLVMLAVAVVVGLGLYLFLSLQPLTITVVNDTASTLEGVAMVSASGFRTAVPNVPAGESVTVRPRLGTSDDDLAMVDSVGTRYPVLGYVTGNPGGKVVVTIAGSDSAGLKGNVSVQTDAQPDGEFALERQ